MNSKKKFETLAKIVMLAAFSTALLLMLMYNGRYYYYSGFMTTITNCYSFSLLISLAVSAMLGVKDATLMAFPVLYLLSSLTLLIRYNSFTQFLYFLAALLLCFMYLCVFWAPLNNFIKNTGKIIWLFPAVLVFLANSISNIRNIFIYHTGIGTLILLILQRICMMIGILAMGIFAVTVEKEKLV